MPNRISLSRRRIRRLASPSWERLCSIDSRIWLVGALLVATATRLPALGQQSLWWDEGITYVRAVLPFHVVVKDLLEARDQVPLYYLLMRVWGTIFGVSEFSLRLPSAFAGVLSVAVLHRLARHCRHTGAGVWGAWLIAVNPFHIWYSREARMYAMAFPLVTEAMRRFLLAIRRGNGRDWLALIAVSATAYLTHYATLAVGIIQLSVLLITFRTTYRSLRKWIMVQTLSAAPAVGWYMLSTLIYGYTGIARGMGRPSLLSLVKTFWNFSLGFDGRFMSLSALGLLPFVAVIACRRKGIDDLWQTSVLLWLALPPFLALVLSLILRPCYMDRYLSICVVAYALWLAESLAILSPTPLRITVGTALLIAMCGSSIGIVSGQRLAKPEWREAVSTVAERAQEGDRLLVGAGIHAAYYYAVDRAVPIEYVDLKSAHTTLTQALHRQRRAWFLYRDPRVTASAHVLIEARRFDPYESGSPEIAEWLSDHGDWISREWFFDGLYLALLESDKRSSGVVEPSLPQ